MNRIGRMACGLAVAAGVTAMTAADEGSNPCPQEEPQTQEAIAETDSLLGEGAKALGRTVSCRGVLSSERNENSTIDGTGRRHPAIHAGPRLRSVAAARGVLPLLPGEIDLPGLTPFSNSEVVATGEIVRNGDGIALRIDAVRFAERRPDRETPAIPPSGLAAVRPGVHTVVVAYVWDGGSAQPEPFLLDAPEPEPWRRHDHRRVQIVEGDQASRGLRGWYRLEGVRDREDPDRFIAVLAEEIDEATARGLLEEHGGR